MIQSGGESLWYVQCILYVEVNDQKRFCWSYSTVHTVHIRVAKQDTDTPVYLPNKSFRLIMVLGYNDVHDRSINWTTISHCQMKGLCDAASIFSSVVPSVVVLLLFVSFDKFSCHGHDSLRNFWYMLYEHICELDVLLLWSSFLPPFFTYRKPITPFRSRGHNNLGIAEDKSFHCTKDVDARQRPSSFHDVDTIHFLCTSWYIFYAVKEAL